MTSLRLLLFVWLATFFGVAFAQAPAPSGETRVPVIFTGGYETEGQDRGRPVILIAAALNVPADVFRKTFSNVKPVGPGQSPEPDQVRKNKQALMAGLGPYGVTDDRLNEVSNYYRYNRSRGEMWRTMPAQAYATVSNGVVTGITLLGGGSGYSSVPFASVKGRPDLKLTVTLAYGTDFAKNGSISEIKLGAPTP